MADPTDDAILEMADRLAREMDLDDDQRNGVVLAVQRLVWPPSPHFFLHDDPHSTVEIVPLEKGGWSGRLACPHGCGRAWTVNIAASREAVYTALTAAHGEYRTGQISSLVAHSPADGSFRRLSLADVLVRTQYVEVQDERMVP